MATEGIARAATLHHMRAASRGRAVPMETEGVGVSYTAEEMAVLRQAIRDHRVADHVTDMVGVERVMGHAVYARKCPNCGRFARPVRGNDVSGRYWMDTHCAQCGDWRVTGHPAVWGAGFQSSKLEEPISFEGIAETYDEGEIWLPR